MNISKTDLSILNDLCYIFESLAQDSTGEAKSEIGLLIGAIEQAEGFDAAEKEKLIEALEDARKTLRNESARHAAFALGHISRGLWNRVMASGTSR